MTDIDFGVRKAIHASIIAECMKIRDNTMAVSTPVPVANWTLATRALESGLRPHDDRPLTGREPFAPS